MSFGFQVQIMSLLLLLSIGLVTVIAKKVYSFDEAIDALEKGYDLKTVQIFSNCEGTKRKFPVDYGGLNIDYFFQESTSSSNNRTINYYDSTLFVNINDHDIDSSVMYNVINATIYENKIGNKSDSYLYFQGLYLNKDLTVNTTDDIHCKLSNDSISDGFYFTIPDEGTYIDHHFKITNFEELIRVLQDGANIRMRINLSAADININGTIVANNGDIFNMFQNGIHSEEVGANWEAIKDGLVSWTTQQFISAPMNPNLQFYILSTTVVNVKDEINVHSAVLDTKMNVVGWINVTDTKLKDIVVFYSDLEYPL